MGFSSKNVVVQYRSIFRKWVAYITISHKLNKKIIGYVGLVHQVLKRMKQALGVPKQRHLDAALNDNSHKASSQELSKWRE